MSIKIMVEVGSGSYLCIEAGAKVGPILEALEGAAVFYREWTKDGMRFKPAAKEGEKEELNITIIKDDCMLPKSPLIDELSASLKTAETRWIEYYNKYNAVNKELEEIKQKVASISPSPADKEEGPAKSDENPF